MVNTKKNDSITRIPIYLFFIICCSRNLHAQVREPFVHSRNRPALLFEPFVLSRKRPAPVFEGFILSRKPLALVFEVFWKINSNGCYEFFFFSKMICLIFPNRYNLTDMIYPDFNNLFAKGQCFILLKCNVFQFFNILNCCFQMVSEFVISYYICSIFNF